LLGRIAGRVIAGLVFQSSADDIFAGLYGVQRTHEHIDFEISGVDIELFVGSEGKTHILAFGVSGFADDDVGRGFDLEHGRDEEFGLGLIGVDVVSVGHPEQERDRSRFTLDSGYDRGGGHLYGWSLRAQVVLCPSPGGEQEDRACEKNFHWTDRAWNRMPTSSPKGAFDFEAAGIAKGMP